MTGFSNNNREIYKNRHLLGKALRMEGGGGCWLGNRRKTNNKPPPTDTHTPVIKELLVHLQADTRRRIFIWWEGEAG